MIWNDHKLYFWAKDFVRPFISSRINPSSLDLSLGTTYRLPFTENWSKEYIINTELKLKSGQFVLMCTHERIKMPKDAAAYISLKSTTARKGIEHLNAGFVDPGFEGQLTLEIINHWPFEQVLYPHEPIVQIVLFDCHTPAKLYPDTGHYQGQTGATPPWMWEKK
jgi:dCTP deaminase